MICIFCGEDISKFKQKPVPISILEFLPWIGQESPGKDTITAAECCQGCYATILANRAKGIREMGKIKED